LNHATESLFTAVRVLFDLQCPLTTIDVTVVLVGASSVPTSIHWIGAALPSRQLPRFQKSWLFRKRRVLVANSSAVATR